MSLIKVDPDKCKKDGLCAEDCPLGLIQMHENELPAAVQGAEKLCIQCGHCVAVCPSGALQHLAWNIKELPELNKKLVLSPEHAEHFLRYRRSIRRYRKKKVNRALLEKLLEMASYAPSGHNSQPVNWLVIENTDEVRELANLIIEWMRFMIINHPEYAEPIHLDRIIAAWERGQDRVLRDAPHLIIAHAPQTFGPAQAACVIALTYLELAATSLGLGSCWAGYFTVAANLYPPLTKRLALPEGHQTFGAVMVGYPKLAYKRLPLRRPPMITWR